MRIHPKLFPCALMALDLASSLVHFLHGDFRRGIYWLAAAALTASVTF